MLLVAVFISVLASPTDASAFVHAFGSASFPHPHRPPSSPSPPTRTLLSPQPNIVALAASGTSSGDEGSILGASLLFAGTAVGAGMLALPAETFDAGFLPSLGSLSLCWLFTYVTSMYTLEASWLAKELSSTANHGGDAEIGGGGFLSISRMALGVSGEVVTGCLFWFLLTSIVVAYTAEGGILVSQFVEEVATVSYSVPPAFGSVIFAAFFGFLASYGTSRVDFINRVFVFGLVTTFVGLVGYGLPRIDAHNLISHADWTAIYPAGISIGILSFGAQNVVPTLLTYLGGNPDRTRRAILFGSLAPLVLYTIWEAVFLGIVSPEAAAAGGVSKMQVVSVLGQAGGTLARDLVGAFSACAIGSSMAGASVSLVDFFEDLVAGKEKDDGAAADSGDARLLAAALALGPPVIVSYVFPDLFLTALEEAGLLGGVSLYGILPALSILRLRGSSAHLRMPGRLRGGEPALYALFLISSGLVLPEIIRLVASVTR